MQTKNKSIVIVNNVAKQLIKAFMPGPITLVLKKKKSLPEYITNDKNTIAVRMATSNELKEIILELKSPIFITSANKSGEPPCSNLDDVEKNFSSLDGILEGDIVFGKSSTIIDCSTEKIKILREGPISEKQINSVLV